MNDTKELILQTALGLFSQNGYKATSVSMIADAVGVTKGALYKHYRNKQAILDSIVDRICQMDTENAHKHEVPDDTYDKSPLPYRSTTMRQICEFMETQFLFWTRDGFARNFRRLLTIEQFKDPMMMDLYQKCLVDGPVSYVEDLFREMINQGVLKSDDPRQLALELYAPFYFLVSMADSSPDKKELHKRLSEHIERFCERNVVLET